MTTFILTGFIIGLSSNFHCIGMCGPIAIAIPVDRKNNFTILKGGLQYNIGRTISYGILGLVIGSIGLTIHTFGVLQWLSIITGALMILFAWRKYFSKLFSMNIHVSGMQTFIKKPFGRLLKSKSRYKLWLLGALNGLLPCGMVFIALINALLTGEVLASSMAMIAFGIGTLPAMIAVIYMINKITTKMRQRMSSFVPYLLTIVGLLIILRGLNLGIPYLSPSVKMVENKFNESETDTSGTLQIDCCHQ